MRKGKHIAIKIAMAVLIILYVIALTVSLMNAGPTVDDVQEDLRKTQQQLAETQKQLAASNKKLDEVIKQLQTERDRNDQLEAETGQTSSGGNFGGGGSSGGGTSNEDQDAGLVDGLTCELRLLCF